MGDRILSRVTPRLSVGAAPLHDWEVGELVEAGVTHVLDCWGGVVWDHPSLTVLVNPTEDDGEPKPPGWFARGIRFALAALEDPGAMVHVCCAAGVNRSPSMVYAILRAMGMDPPEAIAAIRSAHPEAGLRYLRDAEEAVRELFGPRGPGA